MRSRIIFSVKKNDDVLRGDGSPSLGSKSEINVMCKLRRDIEEWVIFLIVCIYVCNLNNFTLLQVKIIECQASGSCDIGQIDLNLTSNLHFRKSSNF